MKKTMKWLVAIVLAPVVLFLILTLLLYLPPVQNWAVRQAASYASEKTGMRVSIEQVNLSFPIDLQLDGLLALKPNDSIPERNDTVADVESLVLQVRMMPLFSGKVEIDEFSFRRLKANTTNFIGDLQVKANLEKLKLVSRGFTFGGDSLRINFADIEGGWLDIALADTVPEDTSSENALNRINIDMLRIAKTDFRLHLPGDTMSVRANFEKAAAKNTELALDKSIYKVSSLDWNGGSLNYDLNYEPRARRGFDASYIAMSELNIGVDSFVYAAPKIAARVRTANFKEKSGLVIQDFRGPFSMDSVAIHLPEMYLKMPGTELAGAFRMEMNAFSEVNPGKLYTRLDGFLSVADLKPFLTSLDPKMLNAIPQKPINVQGLLQGNMKYATFRQLHLAMPGNFDLTATGWIANPTEPARMRSDIALKGKAENLDFVGKLLPREVAKTVKFPHGMGINGNVKIRESVYTADIHLSERRGNVHVRGSYDTRNDAYNLTAKANNLQLQEFLPTMGLHPFSGTVSASGHGMDFFSPNAAVNLSADIGRFQYQDYVLDGIKGRITMKNGFTKATINSTNRMLGGNFSFSGKFTDKLVDGHLKGMLKRIDLKRLGAMNDAYVISAWADVDVRSNLNDRHYIKGKLLDFSLTDAGLIRSRKLVVGDFNLTAAVQGSNLDSHIKGHLAKADLKGLGLVSQVYELSTDADIDFKSNMNDRYSVSGYLGDLKLNEVRGSNTVGLLAGSFNLGASMSGNDIKGSLNGLVANADFYQLGIVDQPFSTNFSANVDFSSDMKDDLMVKGMLGDLQVQTRDKAYVPGDVSLDVLSRRDTTHAVIRAGDFLLNTDLDGSYKQVLASFGNISRDLGKQLANKTIDQLALQRNLPTGRFILESGSGNLFSRLLAERGYAFNSANIDITSSPSRGLNGQILIDRLVYDSLRIDTMQIELSTGQQGLEYEAALLNGPDNDYPYKGYLQGSFFEHGINASLAVMDMKDKPALALSTQAAMAAEGIKLNLTSSKAILGYKQFNVNEDNYVYIGKDRRLSADLQLMADDGGGIQLLTEDADTASLQNLTLSMHKFEIGQLLSVLPLAPKMSGVLDGDYHIVQTKSDLTVSSDMTIRDMIYENSAMGNVGAQFVYIPLEDGTHKIDAILTKGNRQVGELSGSYKSDGEGYLDADFRMDRFPLSYINGFVPDQIVGLRGEGEGLLSVQGPLNQLDIDGELYLDSAHLVSIPYGIDMRFADDPVLIKDSRVEFENFEMFANNDSPLTMAGYLDFSSFDRMKMDVRMRAENFEIIDAKENPRSEVFGKAFVNFNGRMQGLLSNLNLRGKLDVLGTTDMTYVLRDATLTTDNELKDLVQFTNLNDSTPDVIRRPDITGFSMQLGIDIDEQAHIVCALNSDKSNYIDLFGGGSLTMNYDPTNSIQLRGRYTLNSGVMKYSLPIIPLRTFNIQEGSYLEFSGDPMQPLLSIEATEDIKTSVSDGTGQGRLVDFACGVRLTKRFPKPGVEFIIDAPEDQEMQNTLSTKSAEERSKLAVTMLASGMYFDGANNSNANTAMNSALAGFLQSQVNSITGKALNSMGLDITANMESAADANGSLHTDYTFKFSKRLWDNRLRIIMGGRVSTGSQFSERNGAFFDNLSVEYRLNKKETKYLKLYYEREAYDWLEGEQGEYGIGFMWRRKLRHFKDIFKFRSNGEDTSAPQQPTSRDSLINFENGKKK
ncbi:translocation/assembly module TamB domain-containing protein [Prevotella sp. HUN102]|uniref:translocation/assembly module TamB domain-containing protein n=1 Tax=Prevotella sp. HUN102 TaxID=1392486 RepID=UPI000491A7A5|nr:translocation/assembly module TamB domain-containing protein [Prevotella sp. HUN102]